MKIEDIDFLLEYKELYLEENSGKYFVFVDLKQANFNSLSLLDNKLVLEFQTWEEFVGNFIEHELSNCKSLITSKNLRVKSLGKIEHEKIKSLEAHILDLILLVLCYRINFPKDNITLGFI